MLNEAQIYSSENFDNRLTRLIDSLKQYFGFSSKGCFVFFASYGFEHLADMKLDYNHFEMSSGNGSQFRGDTDPEYNAAVDLLINHMARLEGNDKIADILTDKTKLESYMTKLVNLANLTGLALLNSTLSEYKNGVTESDAPDFVINITQLLSEIGPSHGELF
jgi:hypothetical protein